MKQIKLFSSDDNSAPEGVWDSLHTLNGEFHNQGNDSHFNYTLEKDDPDLAGAGYISDDQVRAIDAWLISQGAVVGEEVIISHSW